MQWTRTAHKMIKPSLMNNSANPNVLLIQDEYEITN